jgi:glucose/arabinose dehydrogenase
LLCAEISHFATNTSPFYQYLLMLNFRDFSSTSGLALNGNATQSGTALRLTPAIANQRGSVFASTAIDITASTSFSTQFQFQLAGGQGTGGADGFTFMLQNSAAGTAALGAKGGSLGYEGISNSIAIEFDTYQNPNYDDASANQISILSNGVVAKSLISQTVGLDLNSGNILNAWIDYNGTTDKLDVYLSSTTAKPTTVSLSQTVDLAGAIGGTRAFAGFSAGTGGLSNTQDILNWQFTDTQTGTGGTGTGGTGTGGTGTGGTGTGGTGTGGTGTGGTGTGGTGTGGTGTGGTGTGGTGTGGTGTGGTGTPAINFTDFTTTTGLTLNGNTTKSGNALRLTPAAANQKGSAFYATPFTIDANTSFNTQFQFNLNGGQGTGGADGFTFMLQNATAGAAALGAGGGALGYDGIGKSIAIEFDTYQNPDYDDASANQISLLSNGITAKSLISQTVGLDLNSGNAINVWIDYNGTTDKLDVYLSSTNTKPTAVSLSQTIDLAGIIGNSAFAGFSAGTGGLSNNQDILNWQFTTNATTGTGTGGTGGTGTGGTGGTGTGTGGTGTGGTGTTPPTVNFTDFTNTSGLTLNGNAAKAGNALRLTPGTANQKGSAFYATPFSIDANTGFTTQFQFNLSGGTRGADGFTFMLQNAAAGATALGAGGGSLGYEGIGQSIAIEFDTYQNPTYDDAGDNQISILRNGVVATALTSRTVGIDLNSGSVINVWADYNGVTDQLDVYLASSNNKPATATLSTTIDLFGNIGNRAFAGFSAGTGGLSNNQDILNWQFFTTTPAGTIVMGSQNLSVREGDAFAAVQINRINGSAGAITVEYATKDGTAKGSEDYTTQNSTVTFANGETSKIIKIPILNDTLVEGNETFGVGLVATSAGGLGTSRTVNITILDDDAPASFAFSQANYSVNENAGTATITVQRNGRTDTAATVKYATSNGNGTGNATAGSDYTAATGTLTFAPNEVTKTFTIAITDDTIGEVDEAINLTLSNPSAATLGTQATAVLTIKDNDTGNFTRETVVSGLNNPTTFEWTPNGDLLFVAEKAGVVKVIKDGVVSTFIDLNQEVNGERDRGLLGLAIHPDFYNGSPYVYLAYTYDPPEGAKDVWDNRPSRVVRIKADITSGFKTAVATTDPNYKVVILGKNSNWQYTTQNTNSTLNENIRALPSGIVNGTTIKNVPAADLDRNGNIRDYLAGDSESHSIGAIRFGADKMLYVTNGDGTSYNLVDPRSVRAQDLDNLSGKMLRINPITGEGLADNPFYDGNPNDNRSKVLNYGLRNPFRFTFNPITQNPTIGDVGWTLWEEVNEGRGQNFGWPYFEGGNNGTPLRTGDYSGLTKTDTKYGNNPQTGAFWSAADFYSSPAGQNTTAGIYSYNHNGGSNAIIVGDFYTGNAYPSRYKNSLFIGDASRGTVDVLFFDDSGHYTGQKQSFTNDNIQYAVEFQTGPDGSMYFVNLIGGKIERWKFA